MAVLLPHRPWQPQLDMTMLNGPSKQILNAARPIQIPFIEVSIVQKKIRLPRLNSYSNLIFKLVRMDCSSADSRTGSALPRPHQLEALNSILISRTL